MKIDIQLITRLEQLAAIRLTGPLKSKLSCQLETIVNYFEVIDRVDTTGLSAVAGTEDHLTSALRIDRIIPGLDHDEVMGAAPDVFNGFFKVPQIIDSE
jgi:aspartyl-tRNA(Asn)/glutamyl-tRNA(Gln) amidotransferase subunit C